MSKQILSQRTQWISYLGAFLFILLMIGLANYFSDTEIILPEIAAMAVALFAFREQSWMKQPDKIFILPSITAIIGFGVNYLNSPYLVKLSIVLILMLLLMHLFKYNLAPALATGFLPIVTHAQSLSFVASILIATFLLMIIVLVFAFNKSTDRKSTTDIRKMSLYFCVMMGWMLLTGLLGFEQLAMIPPIAVVAYESLHMKVYNRKMAFKQTVVLFLSASIGVFFFLNIQSWLMVSVLDLVGMFLLLKLFKMQIPAVYAFPFLAFILPKNVLTGLPLAGLCMSIFAFGCILLFRVYETRVKTEMI